MTYNPNQFQHGLSMVQFLERYGTEEQCARAVFASHWPDGFICPECVGTDHCLLSGRGLYQCSGCHRQTSITAGTIFHGTHLPLRKWFLAMHLLTQGKHSVSILGLMRDLGVSYETAWNLKHKLLQVMLERENGRVLSERVEVDDAYMGGERHGGKRGRGAAGKTPFLAAVQTTTDELLSERKVVYLKVQPVNNFRFKTVQEWAKRSLARRATVLTDGMSGFRAIGDVVDHHEMKDMTGGWRSAKHPAFKWVNTILGNLKGNIKGVNRWVSSKHLPRFLAEFQWRFNRRFDLGGILERLLRAAVMTPAMSHRFLVYQEISR